MTNRKADYDKDIFEKEEGELVSDDEGSSKANAGLAPSKRQRSRDRSSDSRSKSSKVDDRTSRYRDHSRENYQRQSVSQRRYDPNHERERDSYGSRQWSSKKDGDYKSAIESRQQHTSRQSLTRDTSYEKVTAAPMDVDAKVAENKNGDHTR